MKTLLLLRHAKSSWKYPERPDHDRPLNQRGKSQAPRVGRWLRQRDLVPEVILSSSARRARKTAEAVAEASGSEAEVELKDELYMAGLDDFLAVLRRAPDKACIVLVVGHNPGLEELLEALTGSEDALPTAAVAHLNLPIAHWKSLGPNTRGEQVDIWRPPRDPDK